MVKKPENHSLLERFRTTAQSHTDRIAIRSREKSTTYGELITNVEALASSLKANTPDGPLAISLPKGRALVESIWAAITLGRPYLCIESKDGADYNLSLLEATGCSALLATNEKFDQSVTRYGRRLTVITPSGNIQRVGQHLADPATIPSDAGCLVQSSGSTGRPKLIPVSTQAILNNADQFAASLEVTGNDRIAWLASTKVAASNSALFSSLLHGATLCPYAMPSGNFADLSSWLANHEISILHLTPSLLRSLLPAVDAGALATVRAIKMGGEALHPSDVELFRKHLPSSCRLWNGLGMSEAGGNICHGEVCNTNRQRNGIIPVGFPLSGYQIRVIDQDANSLPAGEVGELEVTSHFITHGYLGAEDNGRIREADDGARSFRTGDAACLDEDGRLYLSGRRDRQVKIRGFSVDLDQMESELTEFDGILEAAVVQESSHGRQGLTMHVVSELSEESIRRLIGKKFPDRMKHGRIQLSERLPKTASGKLDRNKLTLLSRPSRKEHSVKPRSELERSVAQLWSKVLSCNEPGVYDDFFRSGGDSLAALDLIAELKKHHGQRITPEWIFRHRTVAEMAAAIQSKTGLMRHFRSILKPFHWQSVPIVSGDGGAPWLVLPGGSAKEQDLLVFARIFSEWNHPPAIHGIRMVRGGKLRPYAADFEETAERLHRAVSGIATNDGIRIVGECVAAPLAIALANTLSEQQIEHRLYLLDPRIPQITKHDKPLKKSDIRNYHRMLIDARPGTYRGRVDAFMTEGSMESTQLSQLWGGALEHADIRKHSVDGDHYSYLRRHSKSLADRILKVTEA